MADEQTALLETNLSPLSRRTRARTSRLKTISIVGIITLCVFAILFLRARRDLVPNVIDHEFGVGFDLTSPYGTAAISYPNGTIVNVAKSDASSSFQEMMFRLSLESSRHPSPPYRTLDQAFLDLPRQWTRKALKAVGLPASSDVDKLAQLILALRSSVETHLGGHKISGAAATIPSLPALYEEDLVDAFEYAGLIYVPHWPYWRGGRFHELGAVYAGNGFGLCSNYTDPISCEHEKRNPPQQPVHENILSVSYTREILTSTWGEVGMRFAFPDISNPVVLDWNLGSDKRGKNPKEEYYWAGVRDAIIKPVLEANKYLHRETTKVFLHGECALDERFRKVLKEAVDSVLSKEINIFALDPVYSAARGAAEMAKRTYWSYNHANVTETSLG